jgi:hypothetical protein
VRAWCEEKEIRILCCPDAILGGLADVSDNPTSFAMQTDNGQLASVLMPFASERVMCVVGFTELQRHLIQCRSGIPPWPSRRRLSKNSSFHTALGVCSGLGNSGIRAGALTFGIVIRNDSNYPGLARRMARMAQRPSSSRPTMACRKACFPGTQCGGENHGHHAGHRQPCLGDPRRCRRTERQSDLSRMFRDRRSPGRCGAGSSP